MLSKKYKAIVERPGEGGSNFTVRIPFRDGR
jgi:hypothetical protein